MLSLDEVKDKIQTDLNSLVVSLGFVDSENVPLIIFKGDTLINDDYSWIKAIEKTLEPDGLRYRTITPFALVRETSEPAVGTTIKERLDTFNVYFFVKSSDKDMIIELMETYIHNENFENNLESYEGTRILKNLSNFFFREEELAGAPDGTARHQVDLSVEYDMFPATFLSTKEYSVKIDGVEVPYLSLSFDKANLISASVSNSSNGVAIQGLSSTGGALPYHEFSYTMTLYVDSSNTAITKLLTEMSRTDRGNTTYNLSITNTSGFSHTAQVVANGFSMPLVPPQVMSFDVTFTTAYDRCNITLRLEGTSDSSEQVIISAGKISRSAALKQSTFFGDNTTKSQMLGGGKAFAFAIPMRSNNKVIRALVDECLTGVYTNVYEMTLRYFSLETFRTYRVVVNEIVLDLDNSAYGTMNVSFAEAV